MAEEREEKEFKLSCPIPISDYPQVLLAHGGGGKLMHQLIERLFISSFKSWQLEARHDGAFIPADGARLAFTTDSYVVSPLFFPGGDIGKLAIYGTVNDLAMCGARPLYLSVGFILEEGLEMETLWLVVRSMAEAAERAGVKIITGDTKVVDKGKGDGLFVNTSGIGVLEHDLQIGPAEVRPGDLLLLSGDIGRHGIAIMAVREGLEFEAQLESDCAPLVEPVLKLLERGVKVRCLRDLTRGGLASALVEIAHAAKVHIELDESAIPVSPGVRSACEILGLDPLYVANEGRFVAFIAEDDAQRALKILRSHPLCEEAQIIGQVSDNAQGLVTLLTEIGSRRVVEMLSGEQLPRIC